MTDAEAPAPPRLRLLTREGCGLCEALYAELFPWIVRGELTVAVCAIDDHPDWPRRYGLRIPVLLDDWDETVCEGRLDEAALGDWLSANAAR